VPVCKIQRKVCVVNTAPAVIFTTLHFLRNLGIGPISKLVTSHSAGKAARKKHYSLLGRFVNSKDNTAPGVIFTTLHFICNARLERLAREKHYSLLGLFVNYKDNKEL
jgi:hypothetical protein